MALGKHLNAGLFYSICRVFAGNSTLRMRALQPEVTTWREPQSMFLSVMSRTWKYLIHICSHDEKSKMTSTKMKVKLRQSQLWNCLLSTWTCIAWGRRRSGSVSSEIDVSGGIIRWHNGKFGWFFSQLLLGGPGTRDWQGSVLSLRLSCF